MDEQERQEKAIMLSRLYAEFAKGGKQFVVGKGDSKKIPSCKGPNFKSTLGSWKVINIPKKKIDLSSLIGTEIDMLFYDDSGEHPNYIDKLQNMGSCGPYGCYRYADRDCTSYSNCEIRIDHWNVLENTKGVLKMPKGLVVDFCINDIQGDGSRSGVTRFNTSEEPLFFRNSSDAYSFHMIKIVGLEAGYEW